MMRIVIVSNRLPIVINHSESGWNVRPGSGGLVTALEPVMRQRGGVWIGWPGADEQGDPGLDDVLRNYGRSVGFELLPVRMSKDEIEGFYQGFSNEIIWPLFHDLQSHCNFVPDYWTHYLTVKERFARVVTHNIQPQDFVWVHDYHLMGLGRQLRENNVSNRLGFFLHIPFPPPDLFSKLPWRVEVLQGLLQYDVIGFQTPHNLENFLDCVRKLLPKTRLLKRRGTMECRLAGHVTQIGSFPIGIDYEQFAKAAAGDDSTARVAKLRAQLPDQQIILGLDRLDYTKGIPYRLRAFQLALKRFPELHRKVTLMQVVVPSREAVPEYKDLKTQIEQLVTRVNGEFTQPGWVPIHHVFRSLDWEELLSYYRVADVGLVTPLKDGMNLVAKEYCACQVEGDGVLILSEFAGAAAQMRRDAILVNPYDLDRVADAIWQAVQMTPTQRRTPMRRLRRIVQRQNVYWWVERFLAACGVEGSSVEPVVIRPELKMAKFAL